MLWTEKYRPTKLNHIIGQEHFVMDAALGHGKEYANVLIFGNLVMVKLLLELY